jgi:hypothetical protein
MGLTSRERFELWATKNDPPREEPRAWPLLERSGSGDGYLDLYVQKHWEGWQAGSVDGYQQGYMDRGLEEEGA